MKHKVKLLFAKEFNRQAFTFWALVTIISLSFLCYLGLIIFRVIDASMEEKIHHYLLSKEGRILVRLYIILVVGTLLITFGSKLKNQIHKCQIKLKIQKRK